MFCDTYNALYGDFVFGSVHRAHHARLPPAKRTVLETYHTGAYLRAESSPERRQIKTIDSLLNDFLSTVAYGFIAV